MAYENFPAAARMAQGVKVEVAAVARVLSIEILPGHFCLC